MIFLGPPDAHATRRRSPCSGSHPPTRTGARFRLIGKCDLHLLDPPDKAIDRSLTRPVTVALSPTRTRSPSSHQGGYPVPAQRPEGAPLQGAKVTNRISGESETLMRRADESLSVRHEYDQQRRTFRVAVCEERARAAAGAGAARQARGVLHLNRTTTGKAREVM